MTGIGPVINGLPPATPAQPAANAASPEGIDFGTTLKECIGKVNAEQNASNFAIQDLMAGGGQDVMPAVAAVAKADMSFKLLMGVRNKVVEAYKQMMNMQV